MADGQGSDWLSRSMFLREAEAGPTQQELATMTAPFGGSTQQTLGFMQSPEVQQRLQQMGITGFDPSQIRQSPFFPNSFMQQHPLMGRALSGGMANAAATPEAPLVSGAGSGISRAMQGMYAGPEMARQYQVRQMMAPFQAAGMQMPMMAEQRRQELLKSLEQDMLNRRGMSQQAEEDRVRMEQLKLQNKQMQTEMGRPIGVPGLGVISPYEGQQTQQPQGMPPELGGQISGGGLPPGAMQLPGGHYAFTPYDPNMLKAATDAQHPERQSTADLKKGLLDAGYPAAEVERLLASADASRAGAESKRADVTAGVPGAKADELRSRAGKERAQGANASVSHFDKFSKQYNDAEAKALTQIAEIQRAAALHPDDKNYIAPELAQQQINAWRSWLETAKRNSDQGRSALGASGNYQAPPGSPQDLPFTGGKRNPLLAPNATIPENAAPRSTSPGSAQQGGQGSQQSEGTAIINPYRQQQQ